MSKFKLILLTTTIAGLFACTDTQTVKKADTKQTGYLKNEISQAELNKAGDYKRYSYICKNFETGSSSYLAAYFPLWKESRLKENFGFYFQLDGGKIEPFDHIENRTLNTKGTRFEVTYRSYHPIQGSYVDLKAREHASVYSKNGQAWLECKEG